MPAASLANESMQASRQWTELRLEANEPHCLAARQDCVLLGVAAMLELSDAKEVTYYSGNQRLRIRPPNGRVVLGLYA